MAGVRVQFGSRTAHEQVLAAPEHERTRFVFGDAAFDRGFVMKSNPLGLAGGAASGKSPRVSRSMLLWPLLMLLVGMFIALWRRGSRDDQRQADRGSAPRDR